MLFGRIDYAYDFINRNTSWEKKPYMIKVNKENIRWNFYITKKVLTPKSSLCTKCTKGSIAKLLHSASTFSPFCARSFRAKIGLISNLRTHRNQSSSS